LHESCSCSGVSIPSATIMQVEGLSHNHALRD
jgi:hypothetical protein